MQVQITEFDYSHPTYQCISVVRALALRETEPEAYAKFMQLEDHASEAEKQMIWGVKKPRDIAKFVKRYFAVNDVTEDEITKISGIIMVKTKQKMFDFIIIIFN